MAARWLGRAGSKEGMGGVPDILEKTVRTIPIVIDDPAGEGISGPDRLIRCVYLAIDAVQAAPGWNLGLGDLRIPFFMLGLSGIIYMPAQLAGSAPSPEFRNADDVERTFTAVEESGNLLVET